MVHGDIFLISCYLDRTAYGLPESTRCWDTPCWTASSRTRRFRPPWVPWAWSAPPSGWTSHPATPLSAHARSCTCPQPKPHELSHTIYQTQFITHQLSHNSSSHPSHYVHNSYCSRVGNRKYFVCSLLCSSKSHNKKSTFSLFFRGLEKLVQSPITQQSSLARGETAVICYDVLIWCVSQFTYVPYLFIYLLPHLPGNIS